jgi:FdhD protein
LQRFESVRAKDNVRAEIERPLVIEAPIAIEYNGIGYAVMMATPIDIEDFAYGFSLSEGLIQRAGDILAIDAFEADGGWVLRISLSEERMLPVIERARQRVSESSCGLCGLETLEQVLRPLPRVTAKIAVEDRVIFSALGALRDHQPLNAATGAAHAAAFCSITGEILVSREDVGRHNAMDKLLGALAREEIDAASGFILLTARCSYELVQKAVMANCPLLVTISAASTLAVERAAAHGLGLISLARPDSILVLR